MFFSISPIKLFDRECAKNVQTGMLILITTVFVCKLLCIFTLSKDPIYSYSYLDSYKQKCKSQCQEKHEFKNIQIHFAKDIAPHWDRLCNCGQPPSTN